MATDFGRIAPEAFLDAIRDYAIIQLDLHGSIRSWNVGAEVVLGYAAKDVLGQPLSVLYLGGAAASEAQQLLDAAKTQGSARAAGFRRRLDGASIWVETTLSVVLDDDTTPVGFAKILRAATEPQRKEQTAQQPAGSTALTALGSEKQTNALQRLAALEEAISVMDAGFAMFDADERLVLCNRSYAELYFLAPELIASQPTYEQMIRAQLERFPDFVPSIVGELGVDEWLAGRVSDFRKPSYSAVIQLGERWVRMEQHKTHDGGTVCVRTDVTALKAAEFEARVQERRLQLATTTAGIGIWETDLATGRLNWDARMEQIYEFEPGSFPQTLDAWKARIHPDDLSRVEDSLHYSLQAGEEAPMTYRIVLPEGNIRHIERRGTYIRDTDGKLARRIGVNVDITQRVETELSLRNALSDALAATKAKGEFLATMSHEIRTPLNGVIGMTGLLLATSLDTSQREYTETIRSSGESLLTLINDILDFSKIEAGKLDLESVPVCVPQLVRECVDLFKEQAKAKGLELDFQHSSSEVWSLGDPTRIRQVVLNLISNALKFTDKGGVLVRVILSPRGNDRLNVELEVGDSGIGMSSEYVARIGEAFSQADSTTTRRFGGTGLGLSICRSLVQLMSGTWSVESTLGKGTTFRVKIPMALANPRSIRPNSINAEAEQPFLERVLIVEDNVVNQRVVSLMLRKLVRSIELAMDGREAVEKVRGTAYDCIFMDGHMPEMDGLEATRRIRSYEQESGRPRTAIVALTANALPGDRECFLAAGMDHYLTKPLRQKDLIATLERVASDRVRS